MQIGSCGFAFRKVRAIGPYLARTRRGKAPTRVLAFVVGAAALFGSAEWASVQVSQPTGSGNDLILAHQLERNADFGTDDLFRWTCDTKPVPGDRCTHRTSHVAYILPGFGIADFHSHRMRDHTGADHGIRQHKKSATCKERHDSDEGIIPDLSPGTWLRDA